MNDGQGAPGSRSRAFAQLGAGLLLALVTLWHGWEWLDPELLPTGDFPGYSAQVQYVAEALREHGRVPRWCTGCYGGTSNFTSHLKEYLSFPGTLLGGPILGTKLAFLFLKWLSAFGLFALVVRIGAPPAAGLLAGYAYAFGTIANHQLEHLDVVLGAALWPLLLWAAYELFRRGGTGWALALGGAVALHFINNWVHALAAPVAALAVLAFRPWPEPAEPLRDPALRARWLRAIAASLLVFAVLSASHVAWLGLDSRHHQLLSPELAETQREVFIERSPFLFVNRANVLGPWLAEHQPPGMDLPRWDGERRYLGAVALGICLVGAFALRRERELRRWAALAATLFFFQYWLALGPKTLVWLVGESLHVPPELQTAVRAALAAAALACAAAAGFSAWRPAVAARWHLRAAPALGLAALLALPTFALWKLAALVLPMLAVQRSPGHFFDTAPFWFYLFFALSLAALARRLPRRVAPWAALALAGALVLDHAPSRARFGEGIALAELEPTLEVLATLDGEGGTLRATLPERYFPLGSWALAQAPTGHAWGWIAWQAGVHWGELLVPAWRGPPSSPRTRVARLVPRRALMEAARVRYYLTRARSRPLPEPWRRIHAGPLLALWEQPAVGPKAAGFRGFWLEDAERPDAAELASAAWRRNLLWIAADDPEAREALRAAAAAVVGEGDSSETLRASAALAPPIAVETRRPEPERIELSVDAGDAAAWIFVSEGHHPWWRAQVDGREVPLHRAQLAMMAVEVGPGVHEVELEFRPPIAVAAADWLSVAGWGALGLAGFAGVWRARPRPA